MKYNIAIDGPSGVGKSSVATLLAKKLNMNHLDTGSMYRCVGLAAIKQGIAFDDEPKLEKLLDNISFQFMNQKIFLNGVDVENLIRNDKISMAASDISKLKKIRQKLVAIQQNIASNYGYILDGRDIGSVVLPNAKFKFYLDADAKIRCDRRCKQYDEQDKKYNYNEVLQSIIKRDEQDKNRSESPLIIVEDAIVIDTGCYSLNEVVEKILNIIKEKSND